MSLALSHTLHKLLPAKISRNEHFG